MTKVLETTIRNNNVGFRKEHKMKGHRLIGMFLSVTAVSSLAILAILASGCQKKTEEAAPGAAVAATFANAACPMMDANTIDPKKVTPNLIRDHKGKKVAFCCRGCPAKWDKLSDAEKDAKLAKAAPKKAAP